ncbi:MAG: ABC transporter permease subunit, partial [Proteobacteria bacterium]|nr:ABC transporter permease subunit [Pseudomonadota bacterium]MBT5190260.1 ABC transporter permease subunit [Pseudomonadota bacterium]MBT7812933.1 ABC transporter permease subunit [Pseudomonadota bacterium]
QVGEFTAFLAIIAYAIVPAIRYTEHGLRHVNNDVVEAAIASGCTPFQILWQVRLPLAIPEIMLGLNQTIMFGLAMLIIAALVGTQGLGQAVYVALGQANFGEGLVAGLGIAFIAMSADRIIQAVSAEKKRALGIK